MAKAARKPPQRKPMKARGALPAPRVAPRRVHVVWYRRRSVQILGAVALLILIAIAAKLIIDFRNRSEARKDQAKEIQRFEQSFELIQTESDIQGTLAAMNQAPTEFKSGTLPQAEFKTQTDTWLESFRKFDKSLRARKVPASLPLLEEARAIMVDGAVIYIDAVKQFQIAAATTDTAIRDQAIQQGFNLISHATSVFGKGQRLIQREKRRLGVESSISEQPGGNPLLAPPQLVEEEAPLPPPPAPEGPPPGAIPVPPSGSP